MIAELSQCVATIFSLWLAAEPDVQPPVAAEASPQVSTRASSVQPSSPPEPGKAVAAPQQLGGEESAAAVSKAADQALQATEGADAPGSAVVPDAVVETIQAVEALVMRQPPGRTAFISKEDLQLALKEATAVQPAAADPEPGVPEANSLAEASDRGAATDEHAAPAKVLHRSEQDSDGIIGGTAAAAEGGISHGPSAAKNAPDTSDAPELHMDAGRGEVEQGGGAAPDDRDSGSESEGVMDGLVGPGKSPKPASGAVYDGVRDAAAAATAGNAAPDSGDDYSAAVLDGIAVGDEGAASKGFDAFGENGGSGIHELNDGFADGAFADWDASADDAMQFGAPDLPAEVALLLSCSCCIWLQLPLFMIKFRSCMLTHAARWTIVSDSACC